MVLNRATVKRWSLWWLVFLTALLPLFWLSYELYTDQLGVDPAKTIVDDLGTTAMQLLWLTLAVTPARKILGWRRPLQFRRMLGLYALFYALLHLLAVATFIMGWRIDILVREFSERHYVIAGALALIMLIPLGVTSTKGWQRRLGRRWVKLHRLVYPAALLVLLHFVWLIRASYAEAALYASLLLFLLGYRIYSSAQKAQRS